MEKQKQIEEMASDICNMCRDMYGVCHNKEELCPAIKAEMEYLYNAGYRKIHEGEVVLTREEYKELKYIEKCVDFIIVQERRKTRKETVEKFASLVKENSSSCYATHNGVKVGDTSYTISGSKLDEICKEITEGNYVRISKFE